MCADARLRLRLRVKRSRTTCLATSTILCRSFARKGLTRVRPQPNPNLEIRNPKSETNSKLEIQMFKTNPSTCASFGFWSFSILGSFRISCFGFRIPNMRHERGKHRTNVARPKPRKQYLVILERLTETRCHGDRDQRLLMGNPVTKAGSRSGLSIHQAPSVPR